MTRRKFRIFLSHKVADSKAASALKELLERLFPGKLDVFIAEKMDSAIKWREKIIKELRLADELVLLYSDDTLRWDWPMFEAGCHAAFQEMKGKGAAKLHVVLHENVIPPSPLDDWECVMASRQNPEPVQVLLSHIHKMAKGLPRKRLWKDIVSEYPLLAEAEDLILDVLGKATKDVKDLRVTINLKIKQTDFGDCPSKIPDQTHVQEGARWASQLRDDDTPDQLDWAAFKRNIVKIWRVTPEWEECLAFAIRDMATYPYRTASLPLCRFDDPRRPLLFRPAITRYSESYDGYLSLELSFTEAPGYVTVDGDPSLFQTVQLLDCARVLRWGAILPGIRLCTENIGPKLTAKEVRERAALIHVAMLNVLQEFISKGYMRDDAKESLTHHGVNASALQSMYDQWDACLKDVARVRDGSDDTKPSVLIAELRTPLDEMSKLSLRFLRQSAKALADTLKGVEDRPNAEGKVYGNLTRWLTLGLGGM